VEAPVGGGSFNCCSGFGRRVSWLAEMEPGWDEFGAGLLGQTEQADGTWTHTAKTQLN